MIPIDVVAKISGIPAFSLRNWEKRYGFPMPAAVEHQRRYYSEKQLEVLLQVKELIDSGMRSREAIELARENQLNFEASSIAISSEVDRIYKRLKRLEIAEATELLDQLSKRVSLYQLLDKVFSVILQRVGEDWAHSEASILEEHTISAFVRTRLYYYLTQNQSRPNRPGARKIALGTSQNEHHEGGILLLSAYLSLKNYELIYLGSNLPIEEIVDFNHRKPDFAIGLSYNFTANLKRDLIKLRSLPTPIIIGGRAYLADEEREKLPATIHFLKGSIRSIVSDLDLIFMDSSPTKTLANPLSDEK